VNVLRAAKALEGLPEGVEERRTQLARLHDAVTAFGAASQKPGATVREVLKPLLSAQVFEADNRLIAAFADESPPPDPPKVASKEERQDRLKRGWSHLFETPWPQIARYRDYLNGEAELATHQVVKGSEFPHVMVVMDDYEARGGFFSYDKVFGAEPLSKGDNENIAAGKETTVDRTLRLLYVTCSRAEESLALVLWAGNRAVAAESIKATGWFQPAEIVLLD
jgi:DNA helicase II / ATP-dependent DNA helicase PcrA